MAPKAKFQEGEKVLCYHGPLLYEAKCMRMEVKDGKVQYLIHYNGWNKNWDEWVQESRVVKNNEAGIQKQKELLKNHGAQTKKNKAAKKLEKDATKPKTPSGSGKEKDKEKGTPKEKDKEKDVLKEPKEKDKLPGEKTPKEKTKDKEKKEKEPRQRPSTPQPSAPDKKKEKEVEKDSKEKEKREEKTVVSSQPPPIPSQDSSALSTQTPTGEPKRKRARTEPTVETEETYLSKIEVKIKIPEDLKPVLVDDWDLITRQKMLVSLPCKQTVDDIIEDYIRTKTTKTANINKDAMVETMLGCKDYFNVMLGAQLLYKFERPQYSEILQENGDKPMSSIYGAIHFLRLFGSMLAYTSLDERTVHILLNHVHDFLKYLSKNGPNLFKISNYEIATPDYHRKAI